MLKKLFFTAAAAVTLSVPLAGVSLAEPADAGNDGGVGQGGIPARVNEIAQHYGLSDPNGPDQPNPPGSVSSGLAKVEGSNTPTAYGDVLDSYFPGVYPDKTPPGMGVKAAGPGCNRGNTAADLGQVGNCPR